MSSWNGLFGVNSVFRFISHPFWKGVSTVKSQFLIFDFIFKIPKLSVRYYWPVNLSFFLLTNALPANQEADFLQCQVANKQVILEN